MPNSVRNEDEGEKLSRAKWNLADIMPSPLSKIFQASVLEQLEALLVEFENARSELNENIPKERFISLLNNYEKIARLRAKLGAYSYLYFSEDVRVQDARTFKSRADEIEADALNRTLFFELWCKSLEDASAKQLFADSGTYSYFLERLIQTRKHALSEQVEQTINFKDVTGKNALLSIYHQIRDSFIYEITLAGTPKHLTEEQVRDLFHSGEREERRSAYMTMLRKFGENKDVLGDIYKSLVMDWRNEGIKLRKYSAPISIRNVTNDVSDESVEILLDTCTQNAKLFHRYFKMKAKILNLPEFSRIDIFAPCPTILEKTMTWEQGKDMVLSAFELFHETFARMALKLFSESHIDAEPREGKIGGAYCYSVTPDITPYILMSYTGRPRTVATLAHELGHSIHSQLAGKKIDNELTYEAPLPLAETASVFAELLLMDVLLSNSNINAKRGLLMGLLDDSYATIMRQSYFVLFELEAHEKIAEGINIDELSEKYLSKLREQFGNSVSVPDEFRNEWLSIPHLYQSPFYCYSYAWGNLLVMALYSQFKKEGREAFAPRYIKLLEYGGSKNPEKILAESGFDVNSKIFWQSGFDQLSEIVSELERSD